MDRPLGCLLLPAVSPVVAAVSLAFKGVLVLALQALQVGCPHKRAWSEDLVTDVGMHAKVQHRRTSPCFSEALLSRQVHHLWVVARGAASR